MARWQVRNAWARGAAAGLVAAVPAAALVTLFAVSVGHSGFEPALAAASLVHRQSPPQGLGWALVGLLLHLILSALHGVAWTGMVGRYLRPAAASVAGGAAGLLVWTVMTWFILPISAPALRQLAGTFPFGWLLAHVAWGVTLGMAADALEPADLIRATPPWPWRRRHRQEA